MLMLTLVAFALAVLLGLSWQLFAMRQAVEHHLRPQWLFVTVRLFNIVAILIAAALGVLYILEGG